MLAKVSPDITKKRLKGIKTAGGGVCGRTESAPGIASSSNVSSESTMKASGVLSSGSQTNPLIGRAVKKIFEGQQYNGTVVAFNSPYYLVKYSDGDSEELDKNEVTSILNKSSIDNATPEPMLGRVIRKSFDGIYFIGFVEGCSDFYTVLYEDGDREDLSRDELAEVVLPDSPLQLRMEIDSSSGEAYLYVLTRNNDKASEIARDFGCPEMTSHILALNKKRYPGLCGESKLEAGTRILVPDTIAQAVRKGEALVCKQLSTGSSVSLSRKLTILGICQVCDRSTLKTINAKCRTDLLECASLGCGAKVHRQCGIAPKEGLHYFCPMCMDVPLETELFDIDFKATKFDGQTRFGTSSSSARVASFGIVNSRSATKGVTMSAHSAGVESERMMTKVCALVKEQAPDLKFTSFVVNLNTKFPLHIDTENVGLGGIIGFGEYEGGDLWAHWLPEETKAPSGNRFHDVRTKLLLINGAAPHMTTKFKGRRLTVVLYTRKGFEACDTASTAHLKSVGFQLPDLSFVKKWEAMDYGDVNYRLLSAMKDLVKDQRIRGSTLLIDNKFAYLVLTRYFASLPGSTEYAIPIADDRRTAHLCQNEDNDDDAVMLIESQSSVLDAGENISSSSSKSSTQRLLYELEEIRAEGENAVNSFQTQSKELAASFLNEAEDILERFTLSGHRATARALSLCDKLGRENEGLRAQLESKEEEKGKAANFSSARHAGEAWSTPQAKRQKSALESVGTPLEVAQVAASHNLSQGSIHADHNPPVQGKLPFACFIEDWEYASVLARSDGHTPVKESLELTARFANKYVGLRLCDQVKKNTSGGGNTEHVFEEHRIITSVDWLPQGYRAQTVLAQTSVHDATETKGSANLKKTNTLKGYMVNSTLLELITVGRNPDRAMVSRTICM